MRASLAALTLVTLSVYTVVLNGCGSGRQKPTRLYVLTALPRAENMQQTRAADGVAIGVGPVTLPQYVNRPQIVTGDSGPELQSASFAQWAEPLEDNFARVLAENLSILLATDRVAIFPWKGPISINYQVVIEVTRFLGKTGEDASLVALWSIVGKNGKEVLVSRKSSFNEPTGAQDYEALAAALSRTVASLSRDVAAAITALSQKGPDRQETAKEERIGN